MGIHKNCFAMVVLTSTHNLYFEQKYEKYQSFYICKFSVFGGEIFYIFELAYFRNELKHRGSLMQP